MKCEAKYKILDNLYLSLFDKYQSIINEYKLDFKQNTLDEIDKIYENLNK